MDLSIEQCVTLDEYRKQILGLMQWEVAKDAGCSQTLISFIERGLLIRKASEKYPRILKAYQLTRQADQYVRMVRNAARLKALRTKIKDDFPLELFAKDTERGRVIQIDESILRLAN